MEVKIKSIIALWVEAWNPTFRHDPHDHELTHNIFDMMELPSKRKKENTSTHVLIFIIITFFKKKVHADLEDRD